MTLQINLTSPATDEVIHPGAMVPTVVRVVNNGTKVERVHLAVGGMVRSSKRLPPGGGANLLFMGKAPMVEGPYDSDVEIRQEGGVVFPVPIKATIKNVSVSAGVSLRNPRVLPS